MGIRNHPSSRQKSAHQPTKRTKRKGPALKLGSWNIQTIMIDLSENRKVISDTRKTAVTNDELKRLYIDITTLQDTWLAYGHIEGEGRLHVLLAGALTIPENPSPPRNIPWCICTVCRPMDTESENVCCKKPTCITSYRSLNNICLDRDILKSV